MFQFADLPPLSAADKRSGERLATPHGVPDRTSLTCTVQRLTEGDTSAVADLFALTKRGANLVLERNYGQDPENEELVRLTILRVAQRVLDHKIAGSEAVLPAILDGIHQGGASLAARRQVAAVPRRVSPLPALSLEDLTAVEAEAVQRYFGTDEDRESILASLGISDSEFTMVVRRLRVRSMLPKFPMVRGRAAGE